MTSRDVSIVGAGPVGLALALACARLGFQVAVVDKTDFDKNGVSKTNAEDTVARVDDPRRIVLNWSSVQLLILLGVGEQLYAAGQNIDRVLVRQAGSMHRCCFDASEHNEDFFGVAIGYSDLLHILRTQVLSTPAIETYGQFSPTQTQYQKASLRIANESQSIDSQLVIAVDGTNSNMLDLLAIGKQQHTYNQSASMARCSLSTPLGTTACEIFTPEQTLVLVPGKGSQATAIRMQDTRGDGNWDIKQLNDAFSSIAPSIEQVQPLGDIPLIASRAEEIIRPRFLVCGNAARSMHPLAAQGLNLAYGLIPILMQCLQDTSDPGDWRVLRAYQQEAETILTKAAFGIDGLRRLIAVKPALSSAIFLTVGLQPLRSMIVDIASGANRWRQWTASHD